MVNDSFLVLLVDDESFAREIIGQRLQTLPGVTVAAECTNGVTAREYLLNHKVDMLITDIRMAGMDGLELADFCHRLDPSCGIVIISGHNEFEYARKALQYGVRDYLLKPVHVKSLLELVTEGQRESRNERAGWAVRRVVEHEALEAQLRDLVLSGEADEHWLPDLKTRMPRGGAVVRLELLEMPPMDSEPLGMFLRNTLSTALPKQTVLNLCSQENHFEYLIVDREDLENQREISAAAEFLNRVLSFRTELTQVCRLENAGELQHYRAKLPDSEQKNDLIKIACRYMEAHLNEPITRDQVAQSVYLTSPYFSSLFKKATGMTYSDYLVEIRIRHALKLLERKQSIRAIAEAVGYRNIKYFNRVFKSKMGCLPSEYRKQLLKDGIGETCV